MRICCLIVVVSYCIWMYYKCVFFNISYICILISNFFVIVLVILRIICFMFLLYIDEFMFLVIIVRGILCNFLGIMLK